MPNRFPKLFAFTMLIMAFVHCRPEEGNPPCDNVSCANGGACINGFCDCPDGFGGETYATMDKEVKNGISHRYRALDQLRTYLMQTYGDDA